MFALITAMALSLPSASEKAGVGEECLEHSECQTGLVCVVLYVDDECDGSLEHDETEVEIGNCERPCETDVDCLGETTCNPGGYCS